MTRPANEQTVFANFDDVVLEDRGYRYHLERRGEEFWVEMPDPLWFMEPDREMGRRPPRIEAQVVMTTGSHHMQYFWIRRPDTGQVFRKPDDGSLIHIPWVWLIDEKRWVPSQDSFLRPPTSLVEAPQRWNTVCSSCHSVETRPRWNDTTGRFDTRTTELGIACEACHGPGGEHVRANRSPLRRYALHLSGGDDLEDPTIVDPSDLGARLSSQVCGSCHSFSRPLDPEGFVRGGLSFRPGQRLDSTLKVFRYTSDPDGRLLQQVLANEPHALENRFWSDGTIRVTGREYNGLIETPCFRRGQMTCLSCHSMHDYHEPADQLVGGESSVEAACLDCHSGLSGAIEEHSHHRATGPGARCVNCHMPRTTYGLLGAIRSHRITSPRTQGLVESDRPNACNLCHLDQTLDWSARHLVEWYGQSEPDLAPIQDSIAASVLWVLTGDAAQRAVVGWHMGWSPAQDISGRDWIPPYLAELLTDPYRVNRRIAYRSLLSLQGFGDFRFDYLASPDSIRSSAREALLRWRARVEEHLDRSGPKLLVGRSGNLDFGTYLRLIERRDDSPVRISE